MLHKLLCEREVSPSLNGGVKHEINRLKVVYILFGLTRKPNRKDIFSWRNLKGPIIKDRVFQKGMTVNN